MIEHSIASAGVDIGKAYLDASLADGAQRLRVSNDETGRARLLSWLADHGVRRVGMEASGGYERALRADLREAGFETILFQPAQVRAYAGFRLRRAKNDRIDADLIATCTAAAGPARPAPDPRLEAAGEQLTLIEQIEEDIVRAKTRREGFRDARLRQRIEEEIRRLKAWRAAELRQLLSTLRRDRDLADRLALLLSVPGIGERTALAFMVRMPELGSLTREQAASLAGLAPFDNDSGRHAGTRRIAGGRHRLRKSLVAAALPAAFHWNPGLIALYQRLVTAGKPHKLALIACARKLLIFANSVLQRATPWNPNITTR